MRKRHHRLLPVGMLCAAATVALAGCSAGTPAEQTSAEEQPALVVEFDLSTTPQLGDTPVLNAPQPEGWISAELPLDNLDQIAKASYHSLTSPADCQTFTSLMLLPADGSFGTDDETLTRATADLFAPDGATYDPELLPIASDLGGIGFMSGTPSVAPDGGAQWFAVRAFATRLDIPASGDIAAREAHPAFGVILTCPAGADVAQAVEDLAPALTLTLADPAR